MSKPSVSSFFEGGDIGGFGLLFGLWFRFIWSRAVLLHVVTTCEGDADSEWDQAGEQPRAEVKWCGGQVRGQEIANWIETDGDGQAYHARNHASAQDATTTSLARWAACAVGVDAAANEGHAFTVMQIAPEYDEAKEESEGDEPAQKDNDNIS